MPAKLFEVGLLVLSLLRFVLQIGKLRIGERLAIDTRCTLLTGLVVLYDLVGHTRLQLAEQPEYPATLIRAV